MAIATATYNTCVSSGYKLWGNAFLHDYCNSSHAERDLSESFYHNLVQNVTNIFRFNSISAQVSTKEKRSHRLFLELRDSFVRHHGDVASTIAKANFKIIANGISDWPIRESFVQYNRRICEIKFSVILDNNLQINISKFDKDNHQDVIFSIFHDRELLVTDISSLDKLNYKINQVCDNR